ncbi:MAG TPA: hypothetical protein VFV05_07955 [Methylomirabilota bacterium]|nr:hypothetical protein [Methylomirabilota bacterium]
MIIVLVAFPVIGHATFTILTLLLSPVLPSVMALAANWSEPLGKAMTAATLLVAAATSFGVCRRLWPTVIARASVPEAPGSLSRL